MSAVGEAIPGACLCGALQFRVHPPTKWCAHCHCSLCRRAHGAAFVTWVGVELARFELIAQRTLQWFDSSPGASRGFCAVCGSSVFFKSLRWPGEIHIARASIPGDIDREPSGHVFTDTAVPWCHLGDDWPRPS